MSASNEQKTTPRRPRKPKQAAEPPAEVAVKIIADAPHRRDDDGKTVGGAQAKVSRGNRSRANTRHKLIEAAQRVMAEKGVEPTTIADITERADVGFGSFYNHFTSKEDIVSTIVTLRADEFVKMVRIIMSREDDIATALAFNIKAFLSKALADPIWGWFVIRTQGLVPQIDELFRNEIRKDLQRGVRDAKFDISVDTAAQITLGALISVLRSILEKSASINAIGETSEYLLRLYGVSHERARELSRLPLPQYLIDPDGPAA